MKKYDIIIIGAGTSGATFARSFCDNEKIKRVLLLEAGQGKPPDNEIWTTPKHWQQTLKDKEYHWSDPKGYTKMIGSGGFRLHRAKVGGGCSAHNALAFVTGTSHQLSARIKAFQTLNRHEISEEIQRVRNRYHVESLPRPEDSFNRQIHRTFLEESVDKDPLFNANPEDTEIFTSYQFLMNQDRKRITAHQPRGLEIAPEYPSNLEFQPNTECVRIQVSKSGYATGVICQEKKEDGEFSEHAYELEEHGKLICCAGSLGTPILLARSRLLDSPIFLKEDVLFQIKLIIPSHELEKTPDYQPIRPEAFFFSSSQDSKLDCCILFREASEEETTSELKTNHLLDHELRVMLVWVVVSGLDSAKYQIVSVDNNERSYHINSGNIFQNLDEKDKAKVMSAATIAHQHLKKLLQNIFSRYPTEKVVQGMNEDPLTLPHLTAFLKDPKLFQANHCSGSCTDQVSHGFQHKSVPNLYIADASVIDGSVNGFLHAPTMILGSYVGRLLAQQDADPQSPASS